MSAERRYLRAVSCVACILALSGCSRYRNDDYTDNSPTSGKLKVYCDEGLMKHVRNQAATFEGIYPAARIEVIEASESDAIRALIDDSCEAVVTERLLTPGELASLKQHSFTPKYSRVASTGIAVLVNNGSAFASVGISQLRNLLTRGDTLTDSLGAARRVQVVLDRNNSATLHYLQDSVCNGRSLAAHCSSAGSTTACIAYVREHPSAIALIDFAWISDVDDPLNKHMSGHVRVLPIAVEGRREMPCQSSFRLNSYPLTRGVYVIRKTGEFSLAKGFESFVAGPKGQLTFLKQGLLPARQPERSISVSQSP